MLLGLKYFFYVRPVTSTCLAQSRSHRSPLQRIVLFPKLETCKPLIWKYSFISFLLDRTTTTVISCPYFAVNSISVTPRFPEKPTSCRFCVVRRGPTHSHVRMSLTLTRTRYPYLSIMKGQKVQFSMIVSSREMNATYEMRSNRRRPKVFDYWHPIWWVVVPAWVPPLLCAWPDVRGIMIHCIRE